MQRIDRFLGHYFSSLRNSTSGSSETWNWSNSCPCFASCTLPSGSTSN